MQAKIDAIYFDMDGTIADLYNVPNWLHDLKNENVRPYLDAQPTVSMSQFNSICAQFQALGVSVGVISWGAKGGSNEYTRRVKKAKRTWLERHGVQCDELHVIKYGTPKKRVAKKKNAVLVDDDASVRAKWAGMSVNAQNAAMMIQQLQDLLTQLQN